MFFAESINSVIYIASAGTIRSNLDPFSIYDDPRLWDALRRSYLVEPVADVDLEKEELKEQNKPRYTLDSVVESDGANLSVGERSLLSLARALVKDSKVVGRCHYLNDER
jgi:ATP-binding cassette, subfamily C (CFTR/MRP), member 1